MDRRAGADGVLGLVILVLRRLCDWTQDELGEKAGISGGAISFYEQGEVVPDREKLQRIATATGTTLADIDRLAAEIFRIFEKMSPAALSLGHADRAEAITNALAEDFRVRALPVVRSLAAAEPDLLTRAACELLAEKSTEVSDSADRALELADLALWATARVQAE